MARNTPNAPTNQYTPNFNTVNTVAGFDQGDYVYYNSGDYGRLPNNFVANANFAVPGTFPFISSDANTTGGVTKILEAPPYTGISGGTTSMYGVAKLSNGNIVRVGGNTSRYPYFTITDTSNNVVVAATVVSTTVLLDTNFASVSVAALSGGGFVVAYKNLTLGTVYAVYTNTGTVTLAATNDTTILTTATICPSVLALPNGGFVIAQTTTTAILFRIFNAAGTALYTTTTWTPTTAPATNGGQVSMAARSDSSFVITTAGTGNLIAYYAVYTATNTQTTTGTLAIPISVVTASVFGTSATVLSDGTTFVLSYMTASAGTTFNGAFKFLPSNNIISGEFLLLPTPASGNLVPCFNVFALGLASGNFIVGVTDQEGFITYTVYSSTGAIISGTTTSITSRTAVATGLLSRYQQVCAVEYASKINLFWSESFGYTNNQFSYNLASLSLADYENVPISLTNTITTLGNISLPVNGVVQSTQSPTTTNFYAANTGVSYISSSAPGAISVAATIPYSGACDSLAICTLVNGNIVVAYRVSVLPYTVFASTYTAAGVLITTNTVGNGVQSIAIDSVRVTALTSGKYVVSYASAVGAPVSLIHAVYSSSNALLTTITDSGYELAFGTVVGDFTGGTTKNFDVSAITNDRFAVVGFLSGLGVYVRVYASTGGAVLATSAQTVTGTPLNYNINGLPQGGFSTTYNNSGADYRINIYRETTANNFPVVVSNSAFATSTQPTNYSRYAVGQNGAILAYNSVSAATAYSLSIFSSGSGANRTQYTAPITTVSTILGGGTSVGFTAYNEPVFVYQIGAGQVSYAVTTLTSTSITASGNFKVTDNTLAGGSYAYSPIKMTNVFGRYMAVAYFNGSLFPLFLIFNSSRFIAPFSTTAGVTQSNATSIAAGIVAGIAASTAAPNTTGVLQTNGTCQVNSNYLSTPTRVTFSTGSTAGGYGVSGAVLGRNVTLINNF